MNNKIIKLTSLYNESQEYLAKKTSNLKDFCLKNNCDEFIIKLCDYVEKSSQYILPILFSIFILQYANLMLYLTSMYLLVESFILALVVLQRGKSKFSVRLAKNVILLFIIQFKFMYSFLTLGLVLACYVQLNKSLNCILYDSITYLTVLTNKLVPQIKYIYPDIEELNKSEISPFSFNNYDDKDKERTDKE